MIGAPNDGMVFSHAARVTAAFDSAPDPSTSERQSDRVTNGMARLNPGTWLFTSLTFATEAI